jgi:hypothetical protein
MENKRGNQGQNNSNQQDRDSHRTPFQRVSGPGPNDAGKGAAGREVVDRVEGRPEHSPDDDESE